MTMRKAGWLLAALLAIAARPAVAADRECAGPVLPQGELEPWVRPVPLAAARTVDAAGAATLAPGQAARVALLPGAEVTLAAEPGRASSPQSYAGLLRFTTARAGTYRFALSAPAWIEVVGADGKRAESTAHGHGPACSGIRKIVDFALAPGGHLVQLSGAPAGEITVMAIAGEGAGKAPLAAAGRCAGILRVSCR